jgi:hypothetical protein
MRAYAFENELYRVADLLRSVPALVYLNRLLKAYQLKRGLHFLALKYKRLAFENSFHYQENVAIENFKKKIEMVSNSTRNKKAGEIRVFWVGANRDQDESGFLQALRKIGTVVEFRNWKGGYGQWYWDKSGRVRVYDPEIVALNDNCLLSQIEAECSRGRVDLLLGQMWANYISKEALLKIKSYGIPIVNISMDDRLPDNWSTQRGTRLGAVGLAQVTDLVLTTSSESCAWYGVEGCPAMFWPLASDPGVFAPVKGSVRDIDVLFIGNKYGVREKIIEALRKHHVHVECYGAGWPNGPSTAEQSAALFKRAKIILGVGTVGYCDDVFTLKLRDFDAPMSGALYLTHRSNEITSLYREGIEIECYLNSDEAASKIKYYLSHSDMRETLAAAGHAKALSRDTWTLRLQSTFRQIGLIEDTEAVG